MFTKNTKNKELNKINLVPPIGENFCEVSKASAEIMLDRFCNGNKIDFPFFDN